MKSGVTIRINDNILELIDALAEKLEQNRTYVITSIIMMKIKDIAKEVERNNLREYLNKRMDELGKENWNLEKVLNEYDDFPKKEINYVKEFVKIFKEYNINFQDYIYKD